MPPSPHSEQPRGRPDHGPGHLAAVDALLASSNRDPVAARPAGYAAPASGAIWTDRDGGPGGPQKPPHPQRSAAAAHDRAVTAAGLRNRGSSPTFSAGTRRAAAHPHHPVRPGRRETRRKQCRCRLQDRDTVGPGQRICRRGRGLSHAGPAPGDRGPGYVRLIVRRPLCRRCGRPTAAHHNRPRLHERRRAWPAWRAVADDPLRRGRAWCRRRRADRCGGRGRSGAAGLHRPAVARRERPPPDLGMARPARWHHDRGPTGHRCRQH